MLDAFAYFINNWTTPSPVCNKIFVKKLNLFRKFYLFVHLYVLHVLS